MTTELLRAIMEIAVRMVRSGAEINRVEDSICRICAAYGATRTDIFATTSNLIVSVEDADGEVYTHTRRILSTGTDIERLDRLNALARSITATCPSATTIREELEALSSRDYRYPTAVYILGCGIIAGAFCLFFGGREWVELLVAFAVGALSGVGLKLTERLSVNRIVARFLCSFIGSFLAVAVFRLHWMGTVDNVIIGNIMVLIPGVGLTNSIRDLFIGDTITAILRLIEAILLTIAIACGYVAAALLMGGVSV